MVDTPAGVYLTRAEAEMVLQHTLHVNDGSMDALRARIRRYLDSDWQQRAAARAEAME